MRYTVRISSVARIALTNNAVWWSENRSTEQAIRWYDSFSKAILDLAEKPEKHPLARENDDYPEELRELHFSIGKRITHRALFFIHNDVVQVVDIRHVAQDDFKG